VTPLIHLFKIITCCFFCWSYIAEAESLVIVADKAFPIVTLTLEQVQAIYLGKTRNIDNVGRVVAIDQESDSPIRQLFIDKVLDKTEKQLSSYWSVLIFTGRGNPPHEVIGDAEVKQWLTQHPTGIGYIKPSSVDSSVKVLMSIEN
jgi:ABC-type phosphate transport system substrate-binding protein